MIRRTSSLIPFFLFSALLLTGCGDSGPDEETEGVQEEPVLVTESGQITPEQQQEVLNGIMRAKARQQAEANMKKRKFQEAEARYNELKTQE